MIEKILDLSQETALCGDLSIHIFEELEKMPSRSRLIVKVRMPLDDVMESLSLINETKIAKIIDVRSEDNTTVIVLEKRE